MLAAAAVLVTWLFIYHICRRSGLGEAHLKWPEPVRQTLMKNLLWLIPLLVVLEFFFVLYDTGAGVAYRDSLGRLVFMAMMLTLAAGAAVRAGRQ